MNKTSATKQAVETLKENITLINSQWMSCDSHEAVLASNWLLFFHLPVWQE